MSDASSASSNSGGLDTKSTQDITTTGPESSNSEQKSPPQLPAPVTTNNEDGIQAQFPASFRSFMPGIKHYTGESTLVSELHSTLGPFGITRLTFGSG